MKYLALILLVALVGIALREAIMQDGKTDSPADAPVARADDEEVAGEERLSDYRERYAAAPFDEPIADELYRIIRDLVAGKVGEGDTQALQDRLVAAMEKAELGTAVLRDHAARLAVGDMLQNVSSLLRSLPDTGGEITPQQDQFIRGAASAFAGRLNRQVPGLLISKEHTGSFLTPVVKIDLPKGYERVSWALLSGFEYEEFTPIPESIKALDGHKVGVTGYMITFNAWEDIDEFLLVESVWTCCFGIPPTVPQVIVVRKADGGVDQTSEPLLVLGTLEVGEETEDGFVTSLYRLHASEVRVIK